MIIHGDISQPTTTLIEKISAAVGTLFEPMQIRRLAQANADAATVIALSKNNVSEIEQRGLHRLFQEEGRRQENIERITAAALPQLLTSSRPQDVNDDWITYFFDKYRLTSDADFQLLWSNILAGEANKPGSFSRRTVEVVSTMDKFDAELFTTLCKFIWRTPSPNPLIVDTDASIYKDKNINFASLSHLEHVGLIHFRPDADGGYGRVSKVQMIESSYYSEHFNLQLIRDEEDYHLILGRALFTRVGSELSQVCKTSRKEGFAEYILAYWESRGLEATTVQSVSEIL